MRDAHHDQCAGSDWLSIERSTANRLNLTLLTCDGVTLLGPFTTVHTSRRLGTFLLLSANREDFRGWKASLRSVRMCPACVAG